MSNRTIAMTDPLYAYLLDTTLREPELLRRLREETARNPLAQMQIAPEQGQFMRLLVRMLGVRRAIEVGVFTGYSALSVALALPEDGTLVACDVSEDFTAVARRYFEEGGVASKIDVRIAPAVDTLTALRAEGGDGRFDFAFIDADKESYDAYYELCLALLRPGGVIAVDNALWDGRVADPSCDDPGTVAIRALNAKVGSDPRVEVSLVPIGDGVLLARKL